jgi:putative transposase
MRLLAYIVMSNHFHFVLWPRRDRDVSQFMRWLTVTHTQRHHAHHHTSGTGHLYQGRFRSFPVQDDSHLLTVWRYVEGNAKRVGIVRHAAQWRPCSLWVRRNGSKEQRAMLSDGPIPLPHRWSQSVDEILPEPQLRQLQESLKRGRPFGNVKWTQTAVKRLGLQSTLRPRGRPKKSNAAKKDS